MTTHSVITASSLTAAPPVYLGRIADPQSARSIHPAIGYTAVLDTELGYWDGLVEIASGALTLDTDGTAIFTPVLGLEDVSHTTGAATLERIAARMPGTLHTVSAPVDAAVAAPRWIVWFAA